jgi:hypothetical protein
MNDCQDLMAEDDELQLRVPPVLEDDIRMPSCGERRPSRMERFNMRRHKQKFFTVYDGLSKCHSDMFSLFEKGRLMVLAINI